jgi:hypothetical protein
MGELARVGGVNSGKMRRRLRELKKGMPASERGEVSAAMLNAKPPSRSGGSHVNDWRCPQCLHFNSIQRRMCAKCSHSPANGRLTRGRLREMAAEHRTAAILRKLGLDNTTPDSSDDGAGRQEDGPLA